MELPFFMPRKYLIKSNDHPYHITARVNNREEFYCGSKVAWKIFSDHLNEISLLYQVKIHVFVLMPNHFHLLMTSPAYDLSVVMQKFMWSVTRSINLNSGRTGRVFGGRYHWSLVTTMGYFDYVQKYIYRNPVKAKISEIVQDYEFSTIQNILKEGTDYISLFPISNEDSFFSNHNKVEFLNWLNQPFNNEEYLSIRKGLRKTTFNPTKTNN
jgi:REP element-mobilizing transposase RayT